MTEAAEGQTKRWYAGSACALQERWGRKEEIMKMIERAAVRSHARCRKIYNTMVKASVIATGNANSLAANVQKEDIKIKLDDKEKENKKT